MKTVIIFGAGSTQKLNMPMTIEQVGILENKFIEGNCSDLLNRLVNICNKRFGIINKERKEFLFTINDVFNLLDSNLLLHNGIYEGEYRLEEYELEQCKKELSAFLFETLKERINKKEEKIYSQYINFYEKLALKEIENKKHYFYSNITERSAFISSYSIINFNWDLYSLLPIISAHSNVNHTGSNYVSNSRNPQIRIYTDFQCEYGGSDKDKLWYPFTEPSAFHVNSSKFDSLRRVITVKCFYPHGAMNLFKCSSCSKHSFFLGDLTIDGVNRKLFFNNGVNIYNCPYCEHEIGGMDFDMLPQSNFKVRNSFLEETRLSMIAELQNAERLIFIGYSMPNDDVDYRTLFKSLNAKIKEVYVVSKDNCCHFSDFKNYNHLTKVDKQNETVQRFAETFRVLTENDALFFNMSGVPNAFDSIIELFS